MGGPVRRLLREEGTPYAESTPYAEMRLADTKLLHAVIVPGLFMSASAAWVAAWHRSG